MAEREIRIETGNNSEGLRVYIRDGASDVMLAGFTLDPQQAWDFLRGGTVRTNAVMTNHLDRVGKTMVNESVMYTSEDLKAYDHNDQEAGAETMARADRPGWDEYDGRRRGGGVGGVQVVMRKWVDQ